MRARLVVCLAGVLVLSGVSASAQSQAPARPGGRASRVRITLNAGRQTTTSAFTQSRAFTEYQEQGSLTLTRSISAGPVYDAGISVRVWRVLAVGVNGSFFEDKGSGQITARIPHPFYFDQHRGVDGEVSGVDRREIAGHAQFAVILPVGGSVELTLSAGPSAFAVEQVLVTRVAYTQQYPYTAAAFDYADTERVKDTVIGYNAGADLTWRLGDHFGIGGLARFSRGTKDLQSSGDPVPVETGGLHVAGGIRLIF